MGEAFGGTYILIRFRTLSCQKDSFPEFPYFKNKGKRAFQVFFLYIYTV